MSVPASFSRLTGQWVGDNSLWVFPGDPARTSETTATIALVAQGLFATMHYTWEEGGKPQDGMLLLGFAPAAHAVWIDSWHMQNQAMQCQGEVAEDGVISLKGSYAAPPGPDWGWQIDLIPLPDDTFQMRMFNITPDGEAALAVEANYRRRS